MPRARKSAFQAMSRRQGDAGCAGATAREEGGCRECALSRRGPRSPTRLSPRNQTASRHGFRALIIAVMAAAACLFATTHALPYDAVNADTCRQLVARASQGDLSRVRYLVERMHVSVDCAIARSDGDPHPWALDDVYRDHLDVPAGQLPRRSSHARSLSELMDEEDAEDVTALGNVHRSALHAAVAGGHVEVARFLLASGATADGPARVRLPQSISMASWLMGNAEEEEPTNVFRPYHADAASLTASAVNGVLERSFLSASSSSSSGGDDSNESSSQTFRHWMESDSNVDPRTPLTMAIINNGRHSARIVSDLVKLLILHGASVQVRDSLRMTPLMHVMASCDDGSRDTQPLSLVEDLIEAGANVNAADADGDSVLALALENGCSLDMVQFLVNRGARVEGVANRNGVSLLMRAMEWQLSISGEVRLTAARSFQSLTQLHMPRILLRRHRQQREAASHAESDMGNRTIRLVRLLLAHNADPAHTDRAGNTVLHVALRNRQSVHVISELLSVLNYVDTPDRRGRTPLMLALLYRCDLAIVQRLIQAGADCRAQIASSGRTAMHFAVAGRHTQPMFNMLMMCGSDPGTVDANGMSPLHHLIARRAAHYSDSRVMQEETAVAEALLDHMGDNSMLQSGGALSLTSPLVWAHLHDKHHIVNVLKDHGFQGWLPRFIHAILTDDRDLIRSILDVGESFAVQDRDGISALTYACLRGDQSVVNALLQQRSVDVNAVDVLGRTALFWLVMVAPYTSYDPSDIAQLLLHHGASADIVDMEGRSVVDLVRSQYGDRSGILQILRRVHFDVPTKEVIMDGEVDRTTMEKLLEADGQCSICHEEISCCSVGKSDSQHSGRRVPSDEANQPSLVDCMRHAYHQRCIRRWLDTRQHHTDTPCPMCRAPITTIFKVSSDDDAFREVAAASE